MDIDKEMWKDIEGYDGDYQVSNRGRVRSLKFGREKILKENTVSEYRMIELFGGKGERRKLCLVSRLVAQAFRPDWVENLEVDHINGVKTQNNIENLRMVTREMNRRSFLTKRRGCSSQFRGVTWDKNKKRWQARIQVDGKGKHLGRYDEEEEAARAYNKAAINDGYNPEALNKFKP